MKELNINEAINEANRCLQCENAPCIEACPAKINVRKFIHRIATQNFVGAIEEIRKQNVLGDICSYVCPVEELCVKVCNKTKINYPIMIPELQHFISKYDIEHKIYIPEVKTKKDKKVAIIGGGPAGISCAYYLILAGYKVEIFEKDNVIGGLLKNGIPEYRLNNDIVNRELKYILNIGSVKINYGVEFNKEKNIIALLKNFDAVFIGIGLGESVRLEISKNKKGIYGGIEFLKEKKIELLREKKYKSVAVIGGGNVAIDTAVTLKRAGIKEVNLIYRRGYIEMPAFKKEKIDALNLGINFIFYAIPIKYIYKDEKLIAIKCLRTRLSDKKDKSGRFIPEKVEGSDFIIKTDLVVEAIGQKIDSNIEEILPGIKLTDRKLITVDEHYQTNIERIFAGGDVINGGRTVVEAIKDGREAAKNIIHCIGGKRCQ